MRVYCKNCKWKDYNTMSIYAKRCRIYLEELTPIGNKTEFFGVCEERNKDFNCQYYIKIFWKFWIKDPLLKGPVLITPRKALPFKSPHIRVRISPFL